MLNFPFQSKHIFFLLSLMILLVIVTIIEEKKIELYVNDEGNVQIYVGIQLIRRNPNTILIQVYNNNKETSVSIIVFIQYDF